VLFSSWIRAATSGILGNQSIIVETQRCFLWLRTRDLVRLRFRGAFLGLAWNILQPALYLILFGMVFAVVNRTSYRDYIIYLFAGLVPWRFFEQASQAMTDSIVSSAVFTRGFRVPYFYFPISELGAQLIDFLASFLCLLVLLTLFKAPLHQAMLVLPVSVLVLALIAAGGGLCLSVIFVFFRDIRPMVQMGLMVALFSSSVFFKPEALAGGAGRLWLRANPVCYWVALFQKPIYFGTLPPLTDWVVSLSSGLILLGIGTILYRSLHRKFYFYF
jgi:ABC-type polysaccharide/polyol phosphate export permease